MWIVALDDTRWVCPATGILISFHGSGQQARLEFHRVERLHGDDALAARDAIEQAVQESSVWPDDSCTLPPHLMPVKLHG